MVSTLCYRSQKVWLGQATTYDGEIAPGIEKLRQDPLRAIIPDWSAAGRAAYSTPQLLAPLSYIYWYAINQCSGFPAWAADAWDFESRHLAAGSRAYVEAEDVAKHVRAAGKRMIKPSDYSYCASANLDNRDFYVIGPNRPSSAKTIAPDHFSAQNLCARDRQKTPEMVAGE